MKARTVSVTVNCYLFSTVLNKRNLQKGMTTTLVIYVELYSTAA
jgi:hypothetical protein